MLAGMTLVTSGPYPLRADPTTGWAVVNVHSPHAQTWELLNEELVQAAREHAGEWEGFAGRLSDLLDAGWALQSRGGMYATRATDTTELPELLSSALPRGTVVEWCVPDGTGGLFAVGGLVVGADLPAETFPGTLLPALVENDLTGAQRLAGSEDELRAAVAEELAACAGWWRAHPQELSDQAAHGVLDELERLAATLADTPVPAYVMEKPSSRRMFEDSPRTRVAIYPVSAVTFNGLAEAAGHYSSLTLAPLEGLGQALQARGRELAVELGVARSLG
jgi:hypothetical protein